VVRQLIADCPESADAVSLMGTVHFAFKNPDEAEKWWYKALELDPKRAGNYTVLATAAAIRGDLDRAAELWRQAQTLAPDRPGVYSGYAAVLLTTGKPDEAIAAIEKELALSPANPRCFALLGKAHLQRQDYEKAVENYCRAMEGGQADPAVCYGLAAAYARLGRKDKAEECVQRFQALRAQQGQAGVQDKERGHIDLAVSTDVLVMVLGDAGQTYAEHRNLPKAETCWRRAAAIDPKNQGCRYSLVQLYGATGRPREAVSVCEELRAAAPGSAANETYIGVLLARSGQFDAAEAALRKAIELDPKSPAACRCLVQLLLGRDRVLPEAKAQAARLVELEPSAPHYLLLGQACSRAGDLPAARAAVERALRLEPDNKAVQEASRALQERR
jgi:tetratricopeptide (TPR) repeat protein